MQSLVPHCQGECDLQRRCVRPARSSSLNQAVSEPLSRAGACRRAGGSSRKHGRSASPEAAAVLFWALASSRRRLLHPWQLSSSACPLAAQTRSAPTPQRRHSRQQAVAVELCQYAREAGLCPGHTWLAACGVGGCGVNDGSWHRQVFSNFATPENLSIIFCKAFGRCCVIFCKTEIIFTVSDIKSRWKIHAT